MNLPSAYGAKAYTGIYVDIYSDVLEGSQAQKGLVGVQKVRGAHTLTLEKDLLIGGDEGTVAKISGF